MEIMRICSRNYCGMYIVLYPLENLIAVSEDILKTPRIQSFNIHIYPFSDTADLWMKLVVLFVPSPSHPVHRRYWSSVSSLPSGE